MDGFSRQDATSLSTYLAILRRRALDRRSLRRRRGRRRLRALLATARPVLVVGRRLHQPAGHRLGADRDQLVRLLERCARGRHAGEPRRRARGCRPGAQGREASRPHRRRRPRRRCRSRQTRRRTSSRSRSSTARPSRPRCSQPRTPARSPRIRNELSSKPIVKARREVEALMAQLRGRGPQGLGALHEPAGEGPAAPDAPDAADLEAQSSFGRPGSAARSRPHPKRDAALGLILGIMLGFGVAFGLEALDTRVRSTSELAEGLGGLPLLARIPPPTRGDAEAQRARDGRAAEAQRGRGVPAAAHEPRVRAAERRRRPHDPRHERAREGGQVDDRRQPRGRRGSLGQAGRAGRPRPAPAVHRPLLPADRGRGDHRRRARQDRARAGDAADRPEPRSTRCRRRRPVAPQRLADAGRRGRRARRARLRPAPARSGRVRGLLPPGRDPGSAPEACTTP